MKRPIYFCKSWLRAEKCSIERWSEEQARAVHADGNDYTVLVDSVERPYCFLEVAEKYVVVGFLDEHLRETLTYQFHAVEPRLLFLTMAIYREFEGETDKLVCGTSYLFDRNGSIQIRRERSNPHRFETAVSSADVAANYVSMPAFGEYDELIRVERN